MIYTLTLNPALDFFIKVNNFKAGHLNLSKENYYKSGGKGINVSKVLNHMNIASIALGFVGGLSGNEIIKDLSSRKISHNLIKVADTTRVNVKLFDTSNDLETDINNSSFSICENELKELINFIKNNITENDILVCSGSIPKGIPSTIYKDIATTLHPNTKLFLDTRGENLLENLCNYFLIKPNINELRDALGKDLRNIEDIIDSTKLFLDKGVENILVSMGAEGALLINKLHTFHALPIKVNVINTVGAGDSLVAGFISGMYKNLDLKESFRLAVAIATVTVMSSDKDKYKELPNILDKIKVEITNN